MKRAWAGAPTGNTLARMARERWGRQAASARLGVVVAPPPAVPSDGERVWGEGWIKSSEQIESHTLKGFRQLFERRELRKLGPLWHLHQLFIALLPSCFIMFVCSFITGEERPNQGFTQEEVKAFHKLKLMESLQKAKENGQGLLGAPSKQRAGPAAGAEEGAQARGVGRGGEEEEAARGGAGGGARSKEEEELFYEFLRWKKLQAEHRGAPERP